MSKIKKDWSDYYLATKAIPPDELVVKAMDFVAQKNKAIDIGGGALKDSLYLLEQGFEVTVIDQSPLMEVEAKKIADIKLHSFVSSFENFPFPEEEYDLASAIFSLPFTAPEKFNDVFERIKKCLKKEGIFCGQFFGVNDEWSQNKAMTFHSKEQVQTLLADFEIIYFEEVEKDGVTALAKAKHWHIFKVIAKK